jgi:hypothetical protein
MGFGISGPIFDGSAAARLFKERLVAALGRGEARDTNSRLMIDLIHLGQRSAKGRGSRGVVIRKSLRMDSVPLPHSVLVAIGPTYRFALDRAFDARSVHATPEGQRGWSLGMEEDVLLIDSSLQLSLLTRTLVMAGDSAAVLRDLHVLCAVPAIRSFRVNCPIASDIGGRLLGNRDSGSRKRHESEAEKNPIGAVVSHCAPTRLSTANCCEREIKNTTIALSATCGRRRMQVPPIRGRSGRSSRDDKRSGKGGFRDLE